MFNNYNSCPWDNFAPATVTFCEKSLCAWVSRPAETWSNIGFIIFGIYVLYLVKKENRPHLQEIGYTGIILGITSGIFHANGVFWGEFLDVSSMFLLVCVGASYNLKRIYKLTNLKRRLYMFLATLSAMTMLWFFKPIGITLFGIMFASVVLIEVYIYKTIKQSVDYKYFKMMVVTFLIAWGIWWLDILKILCNPDNHLFTGHSFWHLACSLLIYYIYKFYDQFEELVD